MHAAILRQFAVGTREPEAVAALSPRGEEWVDAKLLMANSWLLIGDIEWTALAKR